LRVAPTAGNNATLNISAGKISVSDTLEIATAGANGTVNLSGTGTLRVGTLSKSANGIFNFNGGKLSADLVAFDLTNSGGTIAPGDSPGLTHVMGDLTLNGGVLEIELAGTMPGSEYDQIVVDGHAYLGGTLDVKLLNGFTPEIGDSFAFLSGGQGFSGMFGEELLPDLGPGKRWAINPGEITMFLEVHSVFTADFDRDGDVDADDLDDWQTAYGISDDADADGDGDSDGRDFLQWQRQYGSGLELITTNVAVPEPTTMILLSLGCTFAFNRRLW
jgi:hypothetical protein